ncbi:MAG: hypothetical protein QOH96_871 [Blastocatellia bacterium]|nr:hypothetical protein [Blastocatellia bacterium]
MKKKNRKVPKKAQGRNRDQPKGFDFGIDETIALIGAIDFSNSLRRANICGCAYGSMFSEATGTSLPFVSLIGTNQLFLEESFREFHRWDEATHGDALDLTFVFLKNAGYLIGISPTREYLDKRFFSMNLIHDPLYTLLTWVKPIDTRSVGIEQIREYKSRHSISPIVFGGAISNKPGIVPHVDYRDLIPITVAPLLKFRVTFIDEADVQPHTTGGIILETSRRRSQDSKLAGKWPQPPVSGLSDFLVRRSKFVARQFPVTIERIRLFPAYQERFAPLLVDGIRSWQCEQAFCNLLLSSRLCSGKFHYTSISFSQLDHSVFDELRHCTEVADGTDAMLTTISTDLLRQQVLLDSEFLLKHCGINISKLSPDQMQSTMALHGLLESNAHA